MALEQANEFRQALESAKAELADQFKDLMDAVKREQNTDRKLLNEAQSSSDNELKTARSVDNMSNKLQDLLSIQSSMISELTNLNNSIKQIGENFQNMQQGGSESSFNQTSPQTTGGDSTAFLLGGGMAVAAAGITATAMDSGSSERSGSEVITRSVESGEVANQVRSGLMERFTSEQMGLDESTAAMITEAFVMNMLDESGLRPDAIEAVPNVHGTRGRGLYQLTGSRRDEYEERYGDDYSIDNQLDFLIYELSNSESSAWESILESSNVGEAAQQIVRRFLRPAAEHRDRRSRQYGADTRTREQALEDLSLILENETVETGEPSSQFLRIDLMKTMVRREETDTRLRQFGGSREDGSFWQQGGQGPHDYNYSDYSLGTSFEWEGSLPSDISEGLNEITLSDGTLANFYVSRVGDNFVSSHLVYAEQHGGFQPGDPINLSYNQAQTEASEIEGNIISLQTLETIAQEFSPEERETMMTIGGDATGSVEEAISVASMRRAEGQSLLPTTIEPTSVFGTTLPELEDISGGGGDTTLQGGSDDLIEEMSVEPMTSVNTPTLAGVLEASGEIDAVPEMPDILQDYVPIAPGLTADGMMGVVPGLQGSPEVQAAMAEQQAATTEQTAGGGTGGSRSVEPSPEISANILGRFGWGENLIKYYGLEDIIQTNMLQ